MIWLVLVAVVFVGGGAWFVAKSMMTRVIVAVVGLVAVGIYFWVGKPNMPDDPLEGRIAVIEAKFKTDPASLNGAEMMAYAEQKARDEPDNPGPHLAIGSLLEMSGQTDQALAAYQDALRRDPNEIETIKRLANLRFKSTGEIDEYTAALYREAYRQLPTEYQYGFFAGVGDWLAGKKADAEAIWADVEAKTPKDDDRRTMFDVMRKQFGIGESPAEAPKGPKTPG